MDTKFVAKLAVDSPDLDLMDVGALLERLRDFSPVQASDASRLSTSPALLDGACAKLAMEWPDLVVRNGSGWSGTTKLKNVPNSYLAGYQGIDLQQTLGEFVGAVPELLAMEQ
jgi:hypothetical protein